MRPKIFKLIRISDESGVSGIGHVLDGVVFPNGKTVVVWCTEDAPSSTVVYDSFNDFWNIHLKVHPTNESIIEWEDGTIQKTLNGKNRPMGV